MEQVDEAEREAAGEFAAPRGELVITAPQMFGRLEVLPVMTEFPSLYPEISVRLVLGDRNACIDAQAAGLKPASISACDRWATALTSVLPAAASAIATAARRS